MSDIKWISATDATFSTASAWEGGVVPGVDDMAIFDGGGVGNCTLDAPIEIGPLTFASGYSGTFATNGFGVKTRGVMTAAPVGGTLDMTGSTWINEGSADLRYITKAATNAIWIQRGGDVSNRVQWIWSNPSLQKVVFDEGCFVDINANIFYANLDILGDVYINSGRIRTNHPRNMYIGPNAMLSGDASAYVVVYSTQLTGYTENIRVSKIAFMGTKATLGNGCIVNVPASFESTTGAANSSVVIGLGCMFLSDLVTVKINDTDTIAVSCADQILISGTADQSIDLAEVDGVIPLSAQKTAGDVTVTGGDFSLTDDSDFGGPLTFASGYSGTFATNGYDVAFGGFDASQTVSGTVNLSTSTIRNRGGFDGRGILTSQLITQNCHWRQEGGDRDAGTVATWQDFSGRDRRFTSLEFTENSNTSWTGSPRLYTRVTVDGKMTVSAILRISGEGSELIVGEHADITGTSYLSLVDCSGTGGISGHTENLTPNHITVRGSTGHISGTYNVPIRLENYDGGDVEINVSEATFNALLRLPVESADPAATLTISFNNVRVAGDLYTTKKFESQTITINGPFVASGASDQTLDFSVATGSVELSAEKSSGNVLLPGGRFALADHFTIADDAGPTGSLTIIGTSALDGRGFCVTVDQFDSTQTTGEVSLALLKVTGDVVTGTSTLVQKISMIGVKNQTVDYHGTSDFPLFHWDKETGSCFANGPVVLFADSRIGEFSLNNMPEGFSLNSKTLNVLGDQLHLIDVPPTKYLFSGELIFSGSDFVLRNTTLPDDFTLTFASSAEVRLISTEDTFLLPGNLHVNDSGRVNFPQTPHATISGRPSNVLSIAGNLNIAGQLSCHKEGLFSILLLGEEKLFRFGKITAGSRSEIAIHIGSNFIQPIQAEIEGRVSLRWNEPCETVKFLSGDYRCLKTLEIPGHIETVSFGAGRYNFDELLIPARDGHATSLIGDQQASVEGFGKIRVTGTGTVNCEMERFCWETLVLEDATFGFSSDEIRIDQPWVTGGTIRGAGSLTVTGRQPFQLDAGAIDVGVLCIMDGDGSITIPQQGYESLTLKADAKDSLVILDGQYQMKNLLLAADNAVLSVDLRNGPLLACSGHVATQTSGHGTVRLCGNGSDIWDFNGSENQSVDMQLEQGFHTLGTVINAKSGGSFTISKPIAAVYYRKPDGTRLAAIANMTLVSDIFITGSLYLLTGDSQLHQAEEGLRLQDVKTTAGNRAIFFAALLNRDGEPIAPTLIEKIALSVMEMNPVAPYLHAPRKIWISHEELELDKVLTPVLQKDRLLPEGGTYNFRYDNVLFDSFPCNHPGLYYVVFEISLYGSRSPIPFRYEILCERP